MPEEMRVIFARIIILKSIIRDGDRHDTKYQICFPNLTVLVRFVTIFYLFYRQVLTEAPT